MQQARVDANRRLYGQRAVTLENNLLRVVVLPECGAKIHQIICKSQDVNVIWTHPRTKPSPLPFGVDYDDHWCGGWDELFPNITAEIIGGVAYPDHGEVWAADWEFSISESEAAAVASFSCRTRISGVVIEKNVSLYAGKSCLNVHYVLRNCTQKTIPILWNLHIALAVSENHELAYPPMRVKLDPAFLGTLEGAPLNFTWPIISTSSGDLDLRKIPRASEKRLHFFYGHELREGWCGLLNNQTGLACGVAFDPKVFPSCWLFGSFGGWRNLNVAVIEPSTGFPYQIVEALKNGICSLFLPGEEIRTTVVFAVAENISKIHSITRDGEIIGF